MTAGQAGLVDALVSAAFSYPEGGRFLDDFPVWASAGVTRLGLFSGNTLVSHVGLRLTRIKTSTGAVPVALIGGVATAPAHRGRGHSTRLLREALQRIDASAAKWALLWGSEHEFYSRFGFSPMGVQARALIADLPIDTRGGLLVTPDPGMNDSIFNDLLARRTGIEFEPVDRSWVIAHRTVEWYSIQQPFAYIGYQRGMDMRNIVHESGGDHAGIMSLLFWVHRKNPAAEILGAPSELLSLGLDSSLLLTEPLCLARPMPGGTEPAAKWNPAFWVSGIGSC